MSHPLCYADSYAQVSDATLRTIFFSRPSKSSLKSLVAAIWPQDGLQSVQRLLDVDLLVTRVHRITLRSGFALPPWFYNKEKNITASFPASPDHPIRERSALSLGAGFTSVPDPGLSRVDPCLVWPSSGGNEGCFQVFPGFFAWLVFYPRWST